MKNLHDNLSINWGLLLLFERFIWATIGWISWDGFSVVSSSSDNTWSLYVLTDGEVEAKLWEIASIINVKF